MDLDLVNIPKELIDRPQWVCWKRKRKDNGKLDKIPIDPHTGQNASHSNPETWGTFVQAITRYRDDKLAGIGYVFSQDDPFCGIDLDDCRNPESGNIETWAREIIQALGSYTEVSQSGKGVHVIGKASLPGGGRKKEHVEIYDRLRFFCVTGQHVDGTAKEIKPSQDAVTKIYNTHFKRNPSPDSTQQRPTIPIDLDDVTLIQKALESKNGDKFDLLSRGQWQEAGYPSQSEADAAFCSMLAFWCGNDSERIDRLFRQTDLMRPKWDKKHHADGSTYGEKTVQRAIASNRETYNPTHNNMPNQALKSPIPEQKGVEEHLNLGFPYSVMSGVAGDFARIYGEHLEPPDHFFFMSYLTIFGLYVSDRLFLNSQRKPAPRLYTILLGESGDTRKSTAMEETERHFREFVEPGSIAICRGAASGEGLGKLLKKVSKVLLYYDELKVFVNKCNIQQSTLLMAANTLFEATRYENQTSRDPFVIEHALISMLAASTTDTYAQLFDSKFLDIGFNNRLFLVPGDSNKSFPVPVPIPNDQIHRLYGQLQNRLKLIKGLLAMPIDEDAGKKWAEFYKQIKGSSPYAKRLDTYGLRLMPLLALNDLKVTVDLETVNKVVTLMEWQHQVREIHDPIDAENKVARMEESIRRAFKQKSMWGYRALQKRVHYERQGFWVWEQATKNLRKNEELRFDPRKKVYSLIKITS